MENFNNDDYEKNCQQYLESPARFDEWGLNDAPVVTRQFQMAGDTYPQATGSMVQQTVNTDNELQELIRQNQHVNTQTRDLLFQNRTLVQRLFPSQKEKMIQEMQAKMISSALEFRLTLYKLGTEFKLEAVREHFNALLLTIRGEYRSRVSRFMLEKLSELHGVVDSRQRAFLLMVENKIRFAETLHPMSRSRYLTAIKKEEEGFLSFTERQVAHFESIIDEQIQRMK